MIACADLVRHTLDLSKATFDNVHTTIATLQTMAEDALVGAIAGTGWLPQEVDDVVVECVAFARRTRTDLKETVDRCHALVHQLVDRFAPPSPAAAGHDAPLREPVAVH